MHNFVIMFSFANNPAPGPGCRDSKKDIIDYMESFQYSTKLFDNAYQVFSMQPLPEFRDNVTERRNPDDSVVIVGATDFKGQNLPNI